jgi:hypothetical protein
MRWYRVASLSITFPRRHRTIARRALRAWPIESGQEARATLESRGYDRVLGVACLVACPAISGLFLGLVAIVGAYPTDGGHAVALGSLVGGIAFAANLVAICLIAVAARVHAGRRAGTRVR